MRIEVFWQNLTSAFWLLLSPLPFKTSTKDPELSTPDSLFLSFLADVVWKRFYKRATSVMKIPLQDLMRNFTNSLFFIVIASVIAVMQNLLYIKKNLFIDVKTGNEKFKYTILYHFCTWNWNCFPVYHYEIRKLNKCWAKKAKKNKWMPFLSFL